MEKTQARIDSQTELVRFIDRLVVAGIEIPKNVTLEIESIHLQKELTEAFLQMHSIDSSNVESVTLKRFEFMGEKISFKSE
jgi:hypothetical protein